jgi:hypothetical protein
MKLLTRTLLILVAALLIAGVLIAFGQSAFADQLRANAPRAHEQTERFMGQGESEGFVGRPGRGERDTGFAGGQRPEGASGAAGAGGRPEGHSEAYVANWRGLAKLGGSLLKIAVIVALFAFGATLWHRRPRAAT